MFNLEWYRIFHRTAQTGNFTKAAQELYITQPSVSYAIKQMENALESKLFHRVSKGVELTVEGAALYDYVEQSFLLLDAGEKKLRELKQLAGGELRVGASDTLFKHLLLPHLEKFHAEYPKVRIRLSHGKTPDIAKRLKDGAIDCGIIHLPLVDPQLDVSLLADIQDTLVVGEAYRNLAGRPLSGEELGRLPFLCLSQGSSTRLFIERWFAAQGIAAPVDTELGSFDLLIELAIRGFGVAFVTRSFVKEALEAGKLFELQPMAAIPPRSIGIAMRRGIALSHAASRFIDLLMTPA